MVGTALILACYLAWRSRSCVGSGRTDLDGPGFGDTTEASGVH